MTDDDRPQHDPQHDHQHDPRHENPHDPRHGSESYDDDQLRDLLEAAVADVRPAPALDRIRARTKVVPMRRTRPWLLVTAGAVAATAATIAAVSLADGRSPQADPGPGPAATTASPSPDATPDSPPDSSDGASPSPAPSDGVTPPPSGTPLPSEPVPATDGPALPAYFVGDTPTGPRLFREFVPAPAGALDDSSALLLAALDTAVAGRATDPDYRSGWPAGVSVVGAAGPASGDPSGSGGESTLQVALDAADDLAARPAGMSRAQAELALQQLVYTAQAVVQQREPVQFTAADGTPLTRLLGVDVAAPVREADALAVQAPVWVISPQDGQQVGRSFVVEGRGAFFEANVSWQLLREDGTVVKEGFATAEECCTLASYAFPVSATRGSYLLRVYDADVSDGEAAGEQEDTKRVTVR